MKVDNSSPFIHTFEIFRDELDMHHDRRERVIKASRDITAVSKKMCVALLCLIIANLKSNLNSPQSNLFTRKTSANKKISIFTLQRYIVC